MNSERIDEQRIRLQILTFRVAGQRYGLPLPDVRQVHRAVAITGLAAGPAKLEGVIDVRGELVPVLALRRRLRHAEKPVDPTEHLIVASARGRAVAIRVDEVEDLVELDQDEIHSASEFVGDAEYVSGIARLAGGLIVIHDLHRFFTPSEDQAVSNALRAFEDEGRVE